MEKNKKRIIAEVPVEEMNSPVNVKIRKCRKSLASTGLGVMAFGLWTLFKTVMTFIYTDAVQITILDYQLDKNSLAVKLMYVLLIEALAGDLAVRFFVGLTARSESRGRIHGKGYLVVSVLLFLASVISIWYETNGIFHSDFSLDAVTTVFFELTSIAVFLDLFISGIRLRVLQKKR